MSVTGRERGRELEQEREPENKAGPPESPRTRIKNIFRSRISYLCSALGGFEQSINENGESVSTYVPGFECLGCLKDLKRFWRMDEQYDERPIARILHEINVLETDLIPILKTMIGTSERGDKMALACADMIGAMTWPIDIQEELKEAHELNQDVSDVDFVGLINAQRHCKAVILRTECIPVLFRIMHSSIAKNKRDRTRKDVNIITLILSIFRNLAAIKDLPPSTDSSTEYYTYSSLQSELIIQFDRYNIFELCSTIGSLADTGEFASHNMIILEILYLVFAGVRTESIVQKPEEVASSNLASLLEKENKHKALQNRKSATRHSNFGTTLSLKTNGRSLHIHKQAALGENPANVIDQTKKKRWKRSRIDDDQGFRPELTRDAISSLRKFALSFLDSAFNTFISAAHKDIRMERPHVKEIDNLRIMRVSSFFLEFFLELQKNEKEQKISPKSEQGHDFDLVPEMLEEHTLSFVLRRMDVCLNDKPPSWTQLHAAIDFFTQLMLCLDAITNSEDEYFREVGNVLQHKLYYQGDKLDLLVKLVSTYKLQSRKYLDSVIHQTYVLLRLLEKYSKSNKYAYVQKKVKRSTKRRKSEQHIYQSDDEESYNATAAYKEHAFAFSEFESKFSDESVLTTYMTFLSGYQEFHSDIQVKHITNLMHRQCVRTNSVALYFRVSILELFERIMSDQKYLPKTPEYQDLYRLLNYVVKKFFKSIQKVPMLPIHAFYPKTKGRIRYLQTGTEAETEERRDGDYDYDDDSNTKTLRTPAELEFKRGFSETQKMGICIALLQETSKEDLVEWIKDVLRHVIATREEIIIATDGIREATPLNFDDEETDEQLRERVEKKRAREEPSEEAKEKIEPYDVPIETEEKRQACTKDANFRLLLRTIKWEDRDDIDGGFVQWTVPSSLLPDELSATIRIIDQFLIEPLSPEDGKAIKTNVQRKRKPRKPRKQIEVDDLVDLSDVDEAIAGRRKAKKASENKQYKSAEFIESDDEAYDQDFFERERQLREERSKKMAEGSLVEFGTKKVSKTKKSRPRKHLLMQSNDAENDTAIDRNDAILSKLNAGPQSDEDDEQQDKNQDQEEIDPINSPPRTLKKRSSMKLFNDDEDDDKEDEDDEESTNNHRISQPSGKRRMIIDDDDDD